MPSDFSFDPVQRQHDDDMEDLTVLFGRNPLPISVNPETKWRYRERFRLRSKIINYYSNPKEKSEICDIARLDPTGARDILMAKSLQKVIQVVREMYQRVLAGQTCYRRYLLNRNIFTSRDFEWEEDNPISLGRGNRLGGIFYRTDLDK